MSSHRQTRSNTRAGASAVPPSVSATDAPSGRRSQVPQQEAGSPTLYVDSETLCYPETEFARRPCAPGLKRLALNPEEREHFGYDNPTSYNSFFFLDHPNVADAVLYLRNPEHVDAQDPKVVKEVFLKAEPVFVRNYLLDISLVLNIYCLQANFHANLHAIEPSPLLCGFCKRALKVSKTLGSEVSHMVSKFLTLAEMEPVRFQSFVSFFCFNGISIPVGTSAAQLRAPNPLRYALRHRCSDLHLGRKSNSRPRTFSRRRFSARFSVPARPRLGPQEDACRVGTGPRKRSRLRCASPSFFNISLLTAYFRLNIGTIVPSNLKSRTLSRRSTRPSLWLS
jgi:hypothetical protein